MTATIQRIHGLNIISAPGMPAAINTPDEARIASLPGLVHYLEPERMTGSPLQGADRATVGHPVVARSAAITLAPAAAYGGRRVLHFPINTSPVAYGTGTCPASWTIVICADLGSGVDTTSNLITVLNPDNSENLKSNFRWSSAGNQYIFEDNFEEAGGHILPAEYMPAGGVPSVWVISYDAATRTSRIGRNSAAVLSTYAHTTAPDPHDAGDQLLIGGVRLNAATSWVGRIGRALVLDRNYHHALYAGLLAREIAAMRAYYALA